MGCAWLIEADIQAMHVGHYKLQSGLFLHRWVHIKEPYNLELSKYIFDNFENSNVSKKTPMFFMNKALILIVDGRDHWWCLWNT
jgi:hypothetical protein